MITSLREGGANLSAFRTFVRFVLVCICRCPLPFGGWEGLRFVIVALPGLFSYLFFFFTECIYERNQNLGFFETLPMAVTYFEGQHTRLVPGTSIDQEYKNALNEVNLLLLLREETFFMDKKKKKTTY